MVLSLLDRNLVWQDWGDVFIVYQPSSAETHVFNETTALILSCLECGALSTKAVRDLTEEALGVDQGELVDDDLTFAIQRLNELGLIEYSDDVSAV